MDRFCLCRNCVDAIRSRGERILTRPMEYDDCSDEESETDVVNCDWCGEDYTSGEMFICM